MRQAVKHLVDGVGLGRPARIGFRSYKAVRGATARAARATGAAITRAPARIADAPAGFAWRRALDAELRKPRAGELLAGAISAEDVPVVMALWSRPERVADILAAVAMQTGPYRYRLILWNNKPANSATTREAIARHGAQGALALVEYVDSPHNLLGMARFVAARNAYLGGATSPVFLTFDDDEVIPDDFFPTLVSRGGPGKVAGWWASWIHGTYWQRIELQADGARANYVGTGGAVWPRDLLDLPALFHGIPMRFRMVEDLWASTLALREGWSLTKVASPIEFVLRERDQGHTLHDVKTDFYEWLR